MRRLIFLGLVLLLLGLSLAGATALDVDGGALQSLRLDVIIDLPEPTEPIGTITDSTQPSTQVPATSG